MPVPSARKDHRMTRAWLDPLTRYYLRDAGARGPLLLMYHAIERRGSSASEWVIPLARFTSHLDLLQGERFRCASLEDIVAGRAGPRSFAITFDDGYEDNLAAFEVLVHRGLSAAIFVVTDHIGGRAQWESDPHLSGRDMMSGAQLRGLLAAGVTVGSHTMTHPHLPKLDRESQKREIAVSRERLGDTLGQLPQYFAYPYGLFDEVAETLVEDAGYAGACSTRSGYHRGPEERFRMRRLTVFGYDGTGTLARKLALADNDGSWPKLAEMTIRGINRRLRGMQLL